MNVTVILNIIYVRQIFSFLFLTFGLGYLFLKTLNSNSNGLSFWEKASFSLGLNLALLMFIGLAVNEICPLIGFPYPLSTTILLMTINLISIPSYLYVLLRRKNLSFSLDNINSVYAALLLSSLPLLSIFGSLMVKSNQGNILLLVMLLVVATLILLVSASQKIIPHSFYPIILFSVCLALLLPQRLVTNYVSGYDRHLEFYVFELTQINSKWNSTIPTLSSQLSKSNAMISVTILPTILSEILGLNGELIFKVVFPLIFSFIPIVTYQLYCTQRDKKTAFLAVFFLASNLVSFGLGPNKQRIAQLFYALIFFTLFTQKLSSSVKKMFFIIFSAALVISHYSTSYIFLFSIVFVWSLSVLSNKVGGKVSLSFVIMFFTLSFSWYIYISRAAPFEDLLSNLSEVMRSTFDEFFNPTARGERVGEALGLSPAPSFYHQIGRLFFWASWMLMLLGVVKVLASMIRNEKIGFDWEYSLFILLNMSMLSLNVLLPGFANTFLAERFYNTGLIVLAPMCVFGGEIILKRLSRLKHHFALLFSMILLIPVFLFQSGFIYEVVRVDSWSIPLSMYRMPPLRLYGRITYEEDVMGAKWLSTHIEPNDEFWIFSDEVLRTHVLISYGMVTDEHTRLLHNITSITSNREFVYLGKINLMNGIIVLSRSQLNTSDVYRNVLRELNKVYSNGNCEIYAGLDISFNSSYS
jgi:uncharacterized membrane protein